MPATSGKGHLTRFLSYVSLICLVVIIFYFAIASGPCDRVRRVVYVFNDIPAKIALAVMRPWTEHSGAFVRTEQFFIGQRLVIANFLVRQFHSQSSYRVMCIKDEGESR